MEIFKIFCFLKEICPLINLYVDFSLVHELTMLGMPPLFQVCVNYFSTSVKETLHALICSNILPLYCFSFFSSVCQYPEQLFEVNLLCVWHERNMDYINLLVSLEISHSFLPTLFGSHTPIFKDSMSHHRSYWVCERSFTIVAEKTKKLYRCRHILNSARFFREIPCGVSLKIFNITPLSLRERPVDHSSGPGET